MELPKQLTPEEQAKIEAERTLSEAELIKGGAEYIVDEETGERRLEVTGGQANRISKGPMREAEKEATKKFVENKARINKQFFEHVESDILDFFEKNPLPHGKDYVLHIRQYHGKKLPESEREEDEKRDESFKKFLIDLEDRRLSMVRENNEDEKYISYYERQKGYSFQMGEDVQKYLYNIGREDIAKLIEYGFDGAA